MKTQALCMLLAAWLSAGALARADAPPLVPLQGFLTDRSNTPLEGEFEMRFALYEQENGGDAVFEESQRVRVQDGQFSALLGAGRDLPLRLFREHDRLFVGVSIAKDGEVKPRLRLATAPYAGFAATCGDASSLGGLPLHQLARLNHTHSAADLQSGELDPARFDAYADLMSSDRLKGDDANDLLTLAAADGRYLPKTTRGKMSGFSDPFGSMPESVELATSSFVKVATQSIEAPGPGHIVAIASASVLSRGMTAPSSFWLTLTGPTQQASTHTSVPAGAVNQATVHGVFPVTSSGTQVFNLTALSAAAEGGVCRGALITLLFVPGTGM